MSAPIVVGFDPHGADDGPVRFGIAAARFTGAPLVVAAVYGGGLFTNRLADGEFQEELSADAHAALERLRTRLEGDADVQAEVRLVEAVTPARGLTTAFEELDAGLAVVGATDRGAVGRKVVGSTAERVIHGAPCPVAVVPGGFEGGELNTVGVAYNDSPEGEQALRSGVVLAQAAGAALRVIIVLREQVGTITGHPKGSREFQQLPGEIAEQHQLGARAAVDAAVAEAGEHVDAEIELVYGDPAEMLAGFTVSLDLLVMGSRAYGPRRAVLLGGVSRRVIADSKCPVVVLPRGAAHPLQELLANR